MTFESILSKLQSGIMKPDEAYDIISEKDMMKRINFYVYFNQIQKDPLNESQLQELRAIVEILQILYNSNSDSPVSDYKYDVLQEVLVDMGIPRLTGSVEINTNTKVAHTFTNLRGTLDKVYYLDKDETRTNKSRRYLDDWIKTIENKYRKVTGKATDLSSVQVMLQPKFDGTSCVLEWDGKNALWLTRGDTQNNRASDVSHIMRIFNDLFCGSEPCAIKFEVMCSEENKDKINEFYRDHPYKNSRQIVTSTLNSNEVDFKCDYLCPVPLRLMHYGDDIETIHPDMIKKYPTLICRLDEREKIREFANKHKRVYVNGYHLRTDGVVITILDTKIQKILGRENDINLFEVAYKFTEECAYTKVKDVEFYVSEFGYITPVLVVYPVTLKGNSITRISLSNKERFDELALSYNDEVLVHYDIIPYVTIDEHCQRQNRGRKIEFITKCPKCNQELDLNVIQVQCKNQDCPSRIVGRIMNFCSCLRIQNIGYQTLDTLYTVGLLKHGIRSLYKLRKKVNEIEDLEGFGKVKTKKIISEIESKRRLKDYEFFGALGIEGLSTKIFQVIFNNIKLEDFINYIENKDHKSLSVQLMSVPGMGPSRVDTIVKFFSEVKNLIELKKLLEEIKLDGTFGQERSSRGNIVFSGCRPNSDTEVYISSRGFSSSDSWSNKAKLLVIPNDNFESSKVNKAKANNIPVIALNGKDPVEVLKSILGDK